MAQQEPWSSPHGLMDPDQGYIAEFLRGRQQASEAAVIARLEARVAELEELLVRRVRPLRAVRLQSHDFEIIPGPDGILSLSVGDCLTIQRDPNGGLHHAKISIDLACLIALLEADEGFKDTICTHCASMPPDPG